MPSRPGDFELTMQELRIVARYAVESAQEVLPIFEQCHPEDPRPRDAVAAARTFADGAPRTRLQRVTAPAANRAGAEASTGAARHAARAAGSAASAAYLHPLRQASQVGHILGAAAHAARAAELAAGGDPGVGDRAIEKAAARADPALVDVLGRYPRVPADTNRVGQLMQALDSTLRRRLPDSP